jgi:hypothetical protein
MKISAAWDNDFIGDLTYALRPWGRNVGNSFDKVRPIEVLHRPNWNGDAINRRKNQILQRSSFVAGYIGRI